MRTNKLLRGIAAIAIPAAALAQAAPRYLSQRDVAEAQRQHPELVAEFGGAETGARAAYVEGVGRRVAAYTGVASTPIVHDLNSAVENAFAVPGGYVYINSPADGPDERRGGAGVSSLARKPAILQPIMPRPGSRRQTATPILWRARRHTWQRDRRGWLRQPDFTRRAAIATVYLSFSRDQNIRPYFGHAVIISRVTTRLPAPRYLQRLAVEGPRGAHPGRDQRRRRNGPGPHP